MANDKLVKHIGDTSSVTFVRFLDYKATWHEKQLVKLNLSIPLQKTVMNVGIPSRPKPF